MTVRQEVEALPVRQDHYLRWDAEYDSYYCETCFTWCGTLKVHADSVEGSERFPAFSVLVAFVLGVVIGGIIGIVPFVIWRAQS